MRPFNKMELLGAALDPEIKNIARIKDEIPERNMFNFIHDSIVEFVPEATVTVVEETAIDEETAMVARKPPKKMRSSLIAKYSSSIPSEDNLSSEINRYLGFRVKLIEVSLEERSDDEKLLSWWRQHAASFPKVAALARTILSIPATSAEPERRFSSAGNVLRERRCSIDPLNMSRILFIHDNRDLLK